MCESHIPYPHLAYRHRLAGKSCALALVGVLCWSACASEPQGVPDQPESRGAANAQSEPKTGHEAASRLLAWSLGSRRASPPRGAARVLWRAAGQPLDQAREVSLCGPDANSFDSMLPIPDENTVLVTIDGVLHTVPASGRGARFEPAAFDPNLSIDHLLAFERGARPAVVLSLVTNRTSGEVSFWKLRVRDGKVVGDRVDSFADFVSLPRFLQRYDTPRCESPGNGCLVVDRHGLETYVTREEKRGTMPRTMVKELSETRVRDVVWGDSGGQWILRGCSTP